MPKKSMRLELLYKLIKKTALFEIYIPKTLPASLLGRVGGIIQHIQTRGRGEGRRGRGKH